mmetsp:Transcript_43093/g.41438  ORF Transcript_43093/g.41438 Transcript_43093/m.41438 type:complete len:103 (-) Transcript_43093:54-362(-)
MTPNQIRYYSSFLEGLERDLNCAGMCYDPNFFLFSDITKGHPNNDCRDELEWYIRKYSGNLAFFMFFNGLMSLIEFGISFSIFYFKKNPFTPLDLKFKRLPT